MTKKSSNEQPSDDAPQPQFDDVLKRMLSSPAKQHKDERVKPKPAERIPQKQPKP